MGQKQITVIEATEKKNIIRTGAYCRVSSNSADQLHSFSAQVQYYTRIIQNNSNMELVDIYADEGFTGTKTDKREEFNRMIADCRKGRLDRILTKSVSRFARNTVDALKYARLLREYGVSILFEKEDIDTAYMSSELLLALSSAQAQEESLSISKNVKWSIEKRMKDGSYLSGSTPYGYRIENRNYVIVEKEAEVVRWIFESYISGMGKKHIAEELDKMKAPKRFGYTTWCEHTVDYMLRNERYMGDALLKKRYRTDTIPFRQVKNKGEKEQYYIGNMNIPIISRETFLMAQERMTSGQKRNSEYRYESPLRSKIRCQCGHVYKSVKIRDKYYWVCRLHNYDISKCRAKPIPEKEIREAFITMVNKLRNRCKEILGVAIKQTETLNMVYGGIVERIKGIDTEIAKLTNKNLVLAKINEKGMLRGSEYTEKSSKLLSAINRLRNERKELIKEQDSDDVLSELRTLYEIISEAKNPLTEFDELLFGEIVREITVPEEDTVCFELISGIKFREKINKRDEVI